MKLDRYPNSRANRCLKKSTFCHLSMPFSSHFGMICDFQIYEHGNFIPGYL